MESSNVNLKTPEGRVSFPKVFEKSTYSDKFECTLVFPKDADLSILKAAALAAAKAKWGDKIPSGLRSPFRKVSEKPETYGEDFDPECIFMGFRSQNRQPGIVDANVQPIIEQAEFYPGCWARISTNAYAYDNKGNKGVAFGLINIQKTQDDDPLAGSAIKAEDDFETIAGSANDPDAYNPDNDELFGGTTEAIDDDDIPF